jgi:hypothetical protein
MDVVGRFMAEFVQTVPSAKERASDLYGTFRDWCACRGEWAPNQAEFGAPLSACGFGQIPIAGRVWRTDLLLHEITCREL